MTRAYHSASSTSLVEACEYAAALRYVAGWSEPEVTWAEIEAGAPYEPRQRSTALGSAMHGMGEAWLLDETPPFSWESTPGQIFRSGYHLLPDPRLCSDVEVESELGDRDLESPSADGPQRYRVIAGIPWAGFIDYRCAPSQEEIDRLGLPITLGEHITIDHKSTSNIRKYVKTVDELRGDLQAAIYAYAHCKTYGVDSAPMRWVYYQTKGATAAVAVDFRLTYAEALAVVAEYAPLARRLDEIESLESAVQNPLACDDYGGRACHHSRGGPCTPQRISPGKRLAQLRLKREKEEKKMAETASFAKFRKPKAEPADAPAEDAAPEPSPAPARTRKPRPAKASAAKKDAAPELPADSVAARVAALSAELCTAEAECRKLHEEYETAKAVLESANAALDMANAEHDRVRDALKEALS